MNLFGKNSMIDEFSMFLKVARLNEKVKDLENKLKQKDHDLEMIASRVDEDVTSRTKSLQEELKKSEEERNNIEVELVKVKQGQSTAWYRVKQDEDKLNKQVQL